jgi:hypothetical protein
VAEAPIEREEVLTIMWTLADILFEVRETRRLLEEDDEEEDE